MTLDSFEHNVDPAILRDSDDLMMRIEADAARGRDDETFEHDVDPDILRDSVLMVRIEADAARGRDDGTFEHDVDPDILRASNDLGTRKVADGKGAPAIKSKQAKKGTQQDINENVKTAGKPIKKSKTTAKKQSATDSSDPNQSRKVNKEFRAFFDKYPQADIEVRYQEALRLGLDWILANDRWNGWRRRTGIAVPRDQAKDYQRLLSQVDPESDAAKDIQFRLFFDKYPQADIEVRHQEALRLGLEWPLVNVRWKNWRRATGIAVPRPKPSAAEVEFRSFFNKNRGADVNTRHQEALRLGLKWPKSNYQWHGWKNCVDRSK
ncbi:hypothetical protein BDZ89DRAFT_1127993 [Hymenopellis radicata]|nr:hypothetical protein BDZ89DRAFT_1127993 [Hymenopellis radicata]